MPSLLVVDDEPNILLAFRRAYRDTGIQVHTAESAEEGLNLAARHQPDVVVLDVQLPDLNGLDVFRRLHALDVHTPVIFITGKSTTDTAIEAMKLGAYDYLFKPLELAQLRQVVDRALALSRMVHVPVAEAGSAPVDERADALVGRCSAMLEVYKAIGRVAAQDVAVLISGESGTGKELVARAIYQHSRRVGAPFLAINCAAIPEQLLESELFGHEKGAFTGADRRRIGKFEQCSGGTLFLDEVGDMSPLIQSKLLRVLQEQRFERLGSNETIRTDVRVLAATNKDLEAMVDAGAYRQDLYYRLSVFAIRLPPLRERGDDLALLVNHYLRRFDGELGKDVRSVAVPALEALRQYSWPGNVRELQSVLKQAMLEATGTVLVPEFLPTRILKPVEAAAEANGSPLVQFINEQLAAGHDNLYDAAVRHVERILLTRVLQHTGGNQLRAAKILGITRGSLRNKIRELGIIIGRSVEVTEEED
jgi:two-component system nitrogen regulation response regulator GlnG